MKKFNQVITVEVSVDSIAQQLLSTMKEDFKHSELLTEAIIASSLDKGNISYVYNSLNGFTNEIDFKIGDEIRVKDEEYTYYTEKGEIVDSSVRGGGFVVGVVKDINIYKSDKLFVEMYLVDRNGSRNYNIRIKTDWVNHGNCSSLANLDLTLEGIKIAMGAAIVDKNGPIITAG